MSGLGGAVSGGVMGGGASVINHVAGHNNATSHENNTEIPILSSDAESATQLNPYGESTQDMNELEVNGNEMLLQPSADVLNDNVGNSPLVEKTTENKEMHTPEQLRVMEEYKNSSNAQIGVWAERKRNGQKAFKYLPVATVNDSVADYIQDNYGIDVHGNSIDLIESSLTHIDNEHINNSSKSKMTNEDLGRIGYVLEHPDEVAITNETTSATRTKDNQEAPKIVLRKRIDGHYYVVEAVTDAKTGQDVVITAFIEEVGKESSKYNELFKGAYHVPSALEDSNPLANVQDVHENSSFNNSIPNPSENVNDSSYTSRTATNTFTNSNMFKNVEQNLEILQGEIDGEKLDVDKVTEQQSLKEAAENLDRDYEGTVAKLESNEAFTGVNTDEAVMIMEKKLEEAKQNGDYGEVKRWMRVIVDKAHHAGQALQAFAKYSRTAEGALVKGEAYLKKQVDQYVKNNPKGAE